MQILNQEPYYIKTLKRELIGRQRKNPSYSLRSFAAHLGLHSSVLSAILKGKRSIPKAKITSVLDKLSLAPVEEKKFLNELNRSKTGLKHLATIKKEDESDLNLLNEQDHFQIIAEWEHYAVLSLLETGNFQSDIPWIAKRLNISEERVMEVISRLIDQKMIKQEKGSFVLNMSNLSTADDVVSKACYKADLELLEMAKEKRESVDINLRHFSNITMAIDPEKLPEAKKILGEFKRKLCNLLEGEDIEKRKEVYLLNLQLFPFTNIEENIDNGENK